MRTTTISTLLLAGAVALAGCSGDGTDVDADTEAGVEADAGTDDTAAEDGEDSDAGADMAADAAVSFGGVEDGATVASPVTVSFETEGFEIIPAADGGGEASGHMHVMVDVGCVAVGEVIPSDDTHVHFGDGSTTAELELEPGEHSLCLQAGDGEHVAMDVTDEITITVE